MSANKSAWGRGGPVTLDWRMMVIGLGRFEPQRHEQVETESWRTAVVGRITEPLLDMLDERGRADSDTREQEVPGSTGRRCSRLA